MGFRFGGRKIVENVSNTAINLDNVKGIISDIGTIISLFIASLLGFPVSTSHVKTISIISLGNKNKEGVKDIFKAWIWTFPVCFFTSFFLSKFLLKIL